MAVNRLLPTGNVDSSQIVQPSRTGKYLEAYTLPLGGAKMLGYGDEGSYYVTYNVTDGTGIAGHVAPVQADLSTKPLLHLFNGNTGSTARTIYIDFVRIRMTAIGASATTVDWTAWVDSNGATTKSGGTGTVATVVNTNPSSSLATGATVTFGVVTATAGVGERRIDHQRIRSVIAVVEDQYVFTFGQAAFALPSAQPQTGTLVVSSYVHMPPAIVPPGGNFKLVKWGASQNGADSYEYTIGWVER